MSETKRQAVFLCFWAGGGWNTQHFWTTHVSVQTPTLTRTSSSSSICEASDAQLLVQHGIPPKVPSANPFNEARFGARFGARFRGAARYTHRRCWLCRSKVHGKTSLLQGWGKHGKPGAQAEVTTPVGLNPLRNNTGPLQSKLPSQHSHKEQPFKSGFNPRFHFHDYWKEGARKSPTQ